ARTRGEPDAAEVARPVRGADRGNGPVRKGWHRAPVRPYCAENEQAANEAVDDFSEAYAAGGVNLGSAITTFCRWGTESLNFHAGHATNAAAEGVNTRIEVLERMAYGFRSRANYTARVLLVCSGHPPAVSP
ncbi:MAG: transposase, partial [Acidimicrobiales bacterium]